MLLISAVGFEKCAAGCRPNAAFLERLFVSCAALTTETCWRAASAGVCWCSSAADMQLR